MTKESLAATLNGRQMGHEITREEEADAKNFQLVVVFGYSDDVVELRGAIHDEISAIGGCHFNVTRGGEVFSNEFGIESVWCAPGEPAWTYKTDIPQATFEILEYDEVYCRGIVFSLADVPKP